jgi:hypothetical protein
MHRHGGILSRPLAEHILQLDVVVHDEATVAMLQSRQHLLTLRRELEKEIVNMNLWGKRTRWCGHRSQEVVPGKGKLND